MPTSDFTDQFNTQLSPQDEIKFQMWARANNKLKDLGDYDLRGSWKNSEGTDERGHGTDKYKKPNHPTFSDESIYHGGKYLGGKWGKDPSGVATTYTPSKAMIDNGHDLWDLQKYMQTYEPDVVLNLPE